jgi:hypothetical protein
MNPIRTPRYKRNQKIPCKSACPDDGFHITNRDQMKVKIMNLLDNRCSIPVQKFSSDF